MPSLASQQIPKGVEDDREVVSRTACSPALVEAFSASEEAFNFCYLDNPPNKLFIPIPRLVALLIADVLLLSARAAACASYAFALVSSLWGAKGGSGVGSTLAAVRRCFVLSVGQCSPYTPCPTDGMLGAAAVAMRRRSLAGTVGLSVSRGFFVGPALSVILAINVLCLAGPVILGSFGFGASEGVCGGREGAPIITGSTAALSADGSTFSCTLSVASTDGLVSGKGGLPTSTISSSVSFTVGATEAYTALVAERLAVYYPSLPLPLPPAALRGEGSGSTEGSAETSAVWVVPFVAYSISAELLRPLGSFCSSSWDAPWALPSRLAGAVGWASLGANANINAYSAEDEARARRFACGGTPYAHVPFAAGPSVAAFVWAAVISVMLLAALGGLHVGIRLPYSDGGGLTKAQMRESLLCGERDRIPTGTDAGAVAGARERAEKKDAGDDAVTSPSADELRRVVQRLNEENLDLARLWWDRTHPTHRTPASVANAIGNAILRRAAAMMKKGEAHGDNNNISTKGPSCVGCSSSSDAEAGREMGAVGAAAVDVGPVADEAAEGSALVGSTRSSGGEKAHGVRERRGVGSGSAEPQGAHSSSSPSASIHHAASSRASALPSFASSALFNLALRLLITILVIPVAAPVMFGAVIAVPIFLLLVVVTPIAIIQFIRVGGSVAHANADGIGIGDDTSAASEAVEEHLAAVPRLEPRSAFVVTTEYDPKPEEGPDDRPPLEWVRTPLSVQKCRVCSHYVEGFDHHCGVVGACIGLRNFPLFLLLLVACVVGVASPAIVFGFSQTIGRPAYFTATGLHDDVAGGQPSPSSNGALACAAVGAASGAFAAPALPRWARHDASAWGSPFPHVGEMMTLGYLRERPAFVAAVAAAVAASNTANSAANVEAKVVANGGAFVPPDLSAAARLLLPTPSPTSASPSPSSFSSTPAYGSYGALLQAVHEAHVASEGIGLVALVFGGIAAVISSAKVLIFVMGRATVVPFVVALVQSYGGLYGSGLVLYYGFLLATSRQSVLLRSEQSMAAQFPPEVRSADDGAEGGGGAEVSEQLTRIRRHFAAARVRLASLMGGMLYDPRRHGDGWAPFSGEGQVPGRPKSVAASAIPFVKAAVAYTWWSLVTCPLALTDARHRSVYDQQ